MGLGFGFKYKVTYPSSPPLPIYAHCLDGLDLDNLVQSCAENGLDVKLLKIEVEVVDVKSELVERVEREFKEN